MVLYLSRQQDVTVSLLTKEVPFPAPALATVTPQRVVS